MDRLATADTLLEWLQGRLRMAGLYAFVKDELADAATFWSPS